MRFNILANVPQTLSLQPFIQFMYEQDVDLESFSKELLELFHQHLDIDLVFAAYLMEKSEDVHMLVDKKGAEHILASLRELIEAIKDLVSRWIQPQRRVVTMRLTFPNIIYFEVIECKDLLLDLNMTVIS